MGQILPSLLPTPVPGTNECLVSPLRLLLWWVLGFTLDLQINKWNGHKQDSNRSMLQFPQNVATFSKLHTLCKTNWQILVKFSWKCIGDCNQSVLHSHLGQYTSLPLSGITSRGLVPQVRPSPTCSSKWAESLYVLFIGKGPKLSCQKPPMPPYLPPPPLKSSYIHHCIHHVAILTHSTHKIKTTFTPTCDIFHMIGLPILQAELHNHQVAVAMPLLFE